MEELKKYVNEKSTEYWNDTADTTQKIEKMPTSIVDFVVEHFFNSSNFPRTYKDAKKVEVMRKYQNTMAMACVEVYAKAGAEGELSHSENSIGRSYDTTWIPDKLTRDLPNYVDFFN